VSAQGGTERRAATLVLDLDGTLVDTAVDLTTTLNVILAKEGLEPVPLDQARKLIGHGAKALIVRGFAANGVMHPPERIDALYKEYLDHYERHIADESRPFPNVVNALVRFAEAGWILAVCTNKLERLSRILLDRLGMTKHFAAICGFDTLPASKPDARAFVETVRRAGGDMASSIMVGDSETDIATARAAGVPVVAVDFGYTTVPIQQLAPDKIISDFAELWDAVAGIRGGKPIRSVS
jgi:phosphoglycolate phosphatase